MEGITVVVWIVSIIGLLVELAQLVYFRARYFLNLHNYVELIVYATALVFVQVDPDNCWCADTVTWQIGAVACVLAWFNLVLILQRLPFTAIPINMMINITISFISIALLPLLLIFTFALPFYMLLAVPVSHTRGLNVEMDQYQY